MQTVFFGILSAVAGEVVLNRFFRPAPTPIAPGAHLHAPAAPHPLEAHLEPTMDSQTKQEVIFLFEQGTPEEMESAAVELLRWEFPHAAQVLANRAVEVRQMILEEQAAAGADLTAKDAQRKQREAANLQALEAERERMSQNIARLHSQAQQPQHIEHAEDVKRPEVFRAMPRVSEEEIGFRQTVVKDTPPPIPVVGDPLPVVQQNTALPEAFSGPDALLASVAYGRASQEDADSVVQGYTNGAVHEGPTEGAGE